MDHILKHHGRDSLAQAMTGLAAGDLGWQNDEETLKELITILETRYPNSSWNAKLAQDGP